MQRAARLAALSLLITIAAFSTSRDFWHELMLGNGQFIGGKIAYDHLAHERDIHRTSQHPPVTVLSCADSRVPPELIFKQTIGDLFIVRVAGNVTDDFPLASIEYAIAKPREYTKLIVVMGHEDCGAVKAAIGSKATGASDPLSKLVARIKSNIGTETDLKKATELNAVKSAEYLVAKSTIIHNAVCTGPNPVILKAAYYDFNGKVTEIPLPPTLCAPSHSAP